MARLCREPACWKYHDVRPRLSWGHDAGRALALRIDFTQDAHWGSTTVEDRIFDYCSTYFCLATAKHSTY